MLYWPTFQAKYVLECTEIKSLPSYYTVILTNIPNYYSEQDLKAYLQELYGPVRNIYSPKNYQNDLFLYRQMCDLIHQYKVEREIYLRYPEDRSCLKLA